MKKTEEVREESGCAGQVPAEKIQIDSEAVQSRKDSRKEGGVRDSPEEKNAQNARPSRSTLSTQPSQTPPNKEKSLQEQLREAYLRGRNDAITDGHPELRQREGPDEEWEIHDKIFRRRKSIWDMTDTNHKASAEI